MSTSIALSSYSSDTFSSLVPKDNDSRYNILTDVDVKVSTIHIQIINARLSMTGTSRYLSEYSTHLCTDEELEHTPVIVIP